MNVPLDLCVTLTAPPYEVPPGVIVSIALSCEELGLACSGGLLTDPLTQHERSDLQWYLEEYWMWPYEGFALHGKEVEALLIELGKRLYHAILSSTQAKNIQLRLSSWFVRWLD